LYWIDRNRTVADYVAACPICQRSKYQVSSQATFNHFSFPMSHGEISAWISLQVFLDLKVLMQFWRLDRLSKYGPFILIKIHIQQDLWRVFVKVVRLHGIPTSIVSDRDPTYLNHFWKEFFRLQSTTLRMSTVFYCDLDG